MFGRLWCSAACFSLRHGLARRRGTAGLLCDALLLRLAQAAAMAWVSESTFAQQSAPQHQQMLLFCMCFALFLLPKKCGIPAAWLVGSTTVSRTRTHFFSIFLGLLARSSTRGQPHATDPLTKKGHNSLSTRDKRRGSDWAASRRETGQKP